MSDTRVSRKFSVLTNPAFLLPSLQRRRFGVAKQKALPPSGLPPPRNWDWRREFRMEESFQIAFLYPYSPVSSAKPLNTSVFRFWVSARESERIRQKRSRRKPIGRSPVTGGLERKAKRNARSDFQISFPGNGLVVDPANGIRPGLHPMSPEKRAV